MAKPDFKTAAVRLRPTLAIVPGSGFHHALTELRVAKSPLHGGMGWIKIAP